MISHDEAARAAQESYGKLIAILAKGGVAIQDAEDALSEAFVAALRSWPSEGVPHSPEGWLITAARRKLIDGERSRSARQKHLADIVSVAFSARATDGIADERLGLMFACAHPAIDPGVRSPLMLQTVLGLDAGSIASAFLVSPAAMTQRLVRAKASLRDRGVLIEIPDHTQLAPRLDDVLSAIYAAFNAGWDATLVPSSSAHTLTSDALLLGDITRRLLADEPEALGLAALMRYCAARARARVDEHGRYVPLDRQDVGRWSRSMLAEAETLLREASRMGISGRFQLEAAIQSAHVHRLMHAHDNWAVILDMYEALVSISPTMGAMLGRAAALAEVAGAERALAFIDQLPQARAADHQPFWALRAELCARSGQLEAARNAYRRAIGLSDAQAIRAYLLEKLDALAMA
ncbi:MAG: hypothetical protein K2W85_05955 [Phycisphaerales bacterium]|nr:hypothetical protein [Phycisphaerales bacterium]